MTHYLTITALQEPNDLGVDPDNSGRVLYGFNVLAWKRPSATILQELIGVLEEAGVGTHGVNIFGSSLVAIPDGDGPFLHLKVTGGTPPIGTHNDGPGATRRPGVQVLVRGASEPAAHAMAQAAFDALIAIRNQAVSA